jgi:TetR/AcrR family transcriptional regulator, transcriptional repressor for nem operon
MLPEVWNRISGGVVDSETIWSHNASKDQNALRPEKTDRPTAVLVTFMTKGEVTRQRIVEAAAPIFNQHGYDGSSLNALMEATGLKKGGIYRHFASKEELAAEAFDYTWEAVWHTRLSHVDEKANAIDKLKQLIANFVERKSGVPGGCPILNTAVDADDGNAVLRARVTKALRSWTSRLETYVEEARQKREARPDIDPRTVATLIVASLEGALMISRIQRSDEALRRVQSHLNRYLDTEVAARR